MSADAAAAPGSRPPVALVPGLDAERPVTRGKPRVLVVADVPGWAHDHKSRALAHVLAPAFEIVIRHDFAVTPDDIAAADLVLVYYWQQLKYQPSLADACRRRRKTVMVGVCSHYELAPEQREEGLRLIRECAGRVFANSRLLEREFAPIADLPVHYTPNGVDTVRFAPGRGCEPVPPLRAGWTGNRDTPDAEHRGVGSVLEPAACGLEGVALVIAARDAAVRDHADMPAFYRGLHVYVCASRSEGTPNPCLEAAACGVPLVTTRVGNMPEFVVDGVNGWLVDRSPQAFAEALVRLRDDEALRRRMGRAARETSLAWDWRVQGPAYAAMFAEALAS
jgi:hypothetical protein